MRFDKLSHSVSASKATRSKTASEDTKSKHKKIIGLFHGHCKQCLPRAIGHLAP